MNIEKDRVVSFIYELRITNAAGESIQKVTKSRPLKIVYGHGGILEPFEKRLLGLCAGDKFEFSLQSKDAYGAYNEKAIVELDKSVFTDEASLDEEALEVGSYFPMETEAGIPFNGKILEITPTKVKMDFNLPLAGQDLYFKGEIVEVREATISEIETGQVERRQVKPKKS
jgi:FKBP-type peptidyl-prolyl cis-trans isomerase SlyD